MCSHYQVLEDAENLAEVIRRAGYAQNQYGASQAYAKSPPLGHFAGDFGHHASAPSRLGAFLFLVGEATTLGCRAQASGSPLVAFAKRICVQHIKWRGEQSAT